MPMPYKLETSKGHWVGLAKDRVSNDFVELTVAVENWGEKTIRVDKRAVPDLIEILQRAARESR